MTIRKLLNYWLKEKRTGFYLFFAFVFATAYLAGALLESYVRGRVPVMLRRGGFLGFLVLLLVFFIHLNLHSCHWFLEHFKDTDRLPKAQIAHVNSFCMTLFLSFSLVVLPASAYALEPVWLALRQWFARRIHPENVVYPDPEFEPEPMNTPDLTDLFGEPRPAPAWMETLDQVFKVLGTVLIIIFFILVVRELIHRVWAWITRPRQFDDDEKIYLKPAWVLSDKRRSQSPGPFFPGPLSYSQRVRRRYRKEVMIQSKKNKISLSPGFSPTELERAVGLNHRLLHRLYEKARYGKEGCTKDEWEKLTGSKSH